MMENVGLAIIAKRDWLSELDGVIGDGDHGVTMEIGWTAVAKALAAAPEGETIEAICKRMAKTFLDAVGASSGPLYATAFLRAGTAVSDRLNLDANAMASWIEAASGGSASEAARNQATRPWSMPGFRQPSGRGKRPRTELRRSRPCRLRPLEPKPA